MFHAKAVAEKTRQRLKKSVKKASAASRRRVPSRSAARGAKHKPVRKQNRQGASRGMTSKKTAARPATQRPVVAVVEQRPAVKATSSTASFGC